MVRGTCMELDFPSAAKLDDLVPDVSMPQFARVNYTPETPKLDDIEETVRSAVGGLPLEALDDGATIAVGVGSRGIHAIDRVATTTVDELAARGYEVIVVPAMGSHGGATPEGQREVLASYDITEERLGCPIDARMETEVLGEADRGFPIHFSTAALEADATLVINRVKAHTNFQGTFESGLTKMSIIGLGKQQGAQHVHEHAIVEGYENVLRDVFEVIRAESNLLGGIALVENFDDRLAEVAPIDAANLPDAEADLLERAYEYMPTLPYDEIDVLVVDRMGKDISGSGMDTNVLGRYEVPNTDDPDTPAIKRIYPRSLTEATHGNGTGIGLADVTRRSVIENLDLTQVYTNTFTSNSLSKAHLPFVVPDDELAMRTLLGSIGPYDPEDVRVVWIRDTSHLSSFRISEALVGEHPDVTVEKRETLTFVDGEATFETAETESS